ncbi:MAG: beta-glucosidase [Acidobacteria bacterium]|nr:beta-glucosidase [Acidobacteriota bacterium]
MTDLRFPAGFVWGAATSAYQIEGSPLADGAGVSNWHRFSHTPGRVNGGDTGDVACDHYNRWPEDIALMREIGLDAYRFSVAWSRILPEGTGRINEKGLDFYRRLVDALREAGMRPMITLYLWDLPAALDDRGGWLNRDIAQWFADYASTLFRALDDRDPLWVTINEPWVVADGGYLHGALAPGHANWFEAPIVSHNLLRAHGEAVDVYRALGNGEIGLVVNLEPKYSATDREEDRAATRRADAYMNRQYLDPVFLGSYPTDLPELFGEAFPRFSPDDFDQIRQPIDFLGINYYTRSVVRNGASDSIDRAERVTQPQATHTTTDWEVYPEGLRDTLVQVTERYGKIPIYVTENGAAFYDPPRAPGDLLEDPLRVDYFRSHLGAVLEAIANGADVRGYYAWSLLDNFEWAHGFSKRFGIIHVDYQTQKRTMKSSGRFLAEVIRRNRE